MLYVANWKMNMNAPQSTAFVLELNTLPLDNENTRVVICAPFVYLQHIQQLLDNKSSSLGAQNCASYDNGAYTGEISARMLAELNCDYCIIGHSERRTILKESNSDIAQKTLQLIQHEITPILCVGETAQEFSAQQTFQVLEDQLAPIAEALEPIESIFELCIAYEPVWSIGTGSIPSNQYIESVLQWLKNYCAHSMPQVENLYLLYGGSVDPIKAPELKLIPNLSGFLIGGASLDFKKFKNIVVC